MSTSCFCRSLDNGEHTCPDGFVAVCIAIQRRCHSSCEYPADAPTRAHWQAVVHTASRADLASLSRDTLHVPQNKRSLQLLEDNAYSARQALAWIASLALIIEDDRESVQREMAAGHWRRLALSRSQLEKMLLGVETVGLHGRSVTIGLPQGVAEFFITYLELDPGLLGFSM